MRGYGRRQSPQSPLPTSNLPEMVVLRWESGGDMVTWSGGKGPIINQQASTTEPGTRLHAVPLPGPQFLRGAWPCAPPDPLQGTLPISLARRPALPLLKRAPAGCRPPTSALPLPRTPSSPQMTNLKLQKRLAASIKGVGKRRVWCVQGARAVCGRGTRRRGCAAALLPSRRTHFTLPTRHPPPPPPPPQARPE